jgi:hypothetical protein
LWYIQIDLPPERATKVDFLMKFHRSVPLRWTFNSTIVRIPPRRAIEVDFSID